MQKAHGSEPRSRGSHRVKAIGLMALAVILFSFLDGTAKYLGSVENLPATQVVWMRFIGQFLVTVMALGAISIPRMLATRRLKQQILRSVLMLFATLMNFIAVRYLRLDQTTTIMFLVPLTVALLAGPALGEWVGWREIVAILTGFGGILVVIRPGFTDVHPAILLSLGCMLSFAGVILLTRYLAGHDSTEATLTHSITAGSLLMAPVALMDWVWPATPFAWLLLLSLGFWAATGHYAFIVAHRWAPASTLAPFIYAQLISVTALGYVVFEDLPDAWTLVGSAIIVASGIYLSNHARAAPPTVVTHERG